jgi:hypothetical protein
MLFVEEVWTSHVNEQGFKGLGIHSKSIIPYWATINFPFIDQNRVYMSQDCENTFCNNDLMTNINKSKGENDIEFNVVFAICELRYFSMQIT